MANTIIHWDEEEEEGIFQEDANILKEKKNVTQQRFTVTVH